ARVLAALDHRREVVQGGVRVRPARRLDPGRDVVVVLVARLVVADGLALHRVLGVRQRHGLSGPLGRGPGQLECVQRRPPLAGARAPGRSPRAPPRAPPARPTAPRTPRPRTRPASGRASSSRYPAARRGSSNAARRTGSPSAAPRPAPAGGPGRRTPPGCAA